MHHFDNIPPVPLTLEGASLGPPRRNPGAGRRGAGPTRRRGKRRLFLAGSQRRRDAGSFPAGLRPAGRSRTHAAAAGSVGLSRADLVVPFGGGTRPVRIDSESLWLAGR